MLLLSFKISIFLLNLQALSHMNQRRFTMVKSDLSKCLSGENSSSVQMGLDVLTKVKAEKNVQKLIKSNKISLNTVNKQSTITLYNIFK